MLPVLSPLNSWAQKAKDVPLVSRLPSVEELQARSPIDDELDAKTKEEADEFYGIARKDFQLIDFSGRHPDPLSRKKILRYVDFQIEIFRTKIVREVAATNGTNKMETIDVKKIFDPSERLVAIVYPDTWAGSSEDSASCQLVTQSRNVVGNYENWPWSVATIQWAN